MIIAIKKWLNKIKNVKIKPSRKINKHSICYADMESLLGKIDTCHNKPGKL